MTIAKVSVGPGESYRNKKTGRVVTLGVNESIHALRTDLFEKIHTGGTISGSAETIADIRKAMDDMRRAPHFLDATPYLRALDAARVPTITISDDYRLWPTPKSDIPAFVEPERPAEPKPEPDSPAVAVLRRLLEDREARVEDYEDDIEDLDERIKELETQLQAARDDREHKRRCASAAEDAVNEIRANIVALGGEV